MMRATSVAYVLAVGALSILAAASARAHEGEQHGSPAATVGGLGPLALTEEVKRTLRIQTEDVDLRTMEETVTCFGSVEAEPGKVYWASSRFPGRVVKVNYNAGERVEAGDVLVEVESRQVAETPVVVPLASPINGTVTERNVSVGQPVEPDTVLYRVIDLSTVYVKCNLYEVDSAEVEVGQLARIFPEAAGGKRFSGPVELIAGMLDSVTRTLPVWVSVENPDRVLRPGMRVRVDLVTRTAPDVVAVPAAAILGGSGNFFVFLDKGDYYVGTPVGLDRRGATTYVEVTEGVVPGDRVVTQGAYQLQFAAARSVVAPVENNSAAVDPGDETPTDQAVQGVVGVRLSRVAQRNLGIRTEAADFHELGRTVECFGMVEPVPANLHHVSTRINGRVTRVHVLEGERVERGQLLAEIESRQIAEPPPAIKIYASLGGVVTQRHVFVGEPVNPDKALFTLARLDELLVKCHVAEPDVPSLAPGQPVRIYSTAYQQEVFAGRLAYLGGEIDGNTRTLPAFIRVDAPNGKLRPNMRVEARVVVGESDEVIAVPRPAVLSPDRSNTFVFIRSGDYFRHQRVTLGRKDERYFEILDGILPGDLVVTQGNNALQFATNSPETPEPGPPQSPQAQPLEPGERDTGWKQWLPF